MKAFVSVCLLLVATGCSSSSQKNWPASSQESLVEQPEVASAQQAVVIEDLVNATGLYEGTYTCPQGKSGLSLELYVDANGAAWGVFKLFSIPESNYEFAGAFNTRGKIERDGAFRFDAEETDWITQPEGFVTIDLEGVLDDEAGAMSGTIVQPECSVFEAMRVK